MQVGRGGTDRKWMGADIKQFLCLRITHLFEIILKEAKNDVDVVPPISLGSSGAKQRTKLTSDSLVGEKNHLIRYV